MSAAGRLLPGQHANEDGGGTSDALMHLNGAERAIEGAGTALHAAVALRDADLVSLGFENPVRADGQALSAAGALFGIILQGDDIFQVLHAGGPFIDGSRLSGRFSTRSPVHPIRPDATATPSTSRRMTPMADRESISGKAIFISRSTPDRDVNVELPVKLIVMKADTDGRKSR